MRSLITVCLVVALAALLATPALAQRPGGGGGFQMSVSDLLQQESVQKELKLEKEAIDKIKETMTKFREDHKADYDKLRDQNTSREERAEINKKLTEETAKALKDVIKPEQLARVQQIQRQRRGVQVFTDPEVLATLKLDDTQKDDIKKIAEDVTKDVGEILRDAGRDPTKLGEARKKMEAMNAEAVEKVSKTLKDDQKKALKELLGDKFEGEIRIQPRRPGGNPNGAGAGQGRGRRPGGARPPV